DFRESKKDAIVGICKTCVSLGETQARLAQLVSALPRHGRGHWFESSIAHRITFLVIHADVAQLARAPPCQGGGRGIESRHPLATPSGWGGRVVRQRPAKPRTRVRFPSPPRSDFQHCSKNC